MSLCSLIPILTGLGTALFGGLAAWHWFKSRLDGLTAECEASNASATQYGAQYANLKAEYDSYQTNTHGQMEDLKVRYSALEYEKSKVDARLSAMPVGIPITNDLKIVETVKEIEMVAEVRTAVEFVRNVEVPVEVVHEVERIVEVPVQVIHEVEKIVEVPVEVVREVERIVETVREVPVETIKELEMVTVVRTPVAVKRMVEVPVEVVREVEKIVEVEKLEERPANPTLDRALGSRPAAAAFTAETSFEFDLGNGEPVDIGEEAKLPLAIGTARRDDLKIIEGIGPKIEGLLNAAGIWSLASLAATPAEQVKAILTAAGDRYAIHDPATWGHQSFLAANGRWEALKTLQDELVGGKQAVA